MGRQSDWRASLDLDIPTQQLINHWLHLASKKDWLALEESLNLYHSKHFARTNTDDLSTPSVGSLYPNNQVRTSLIMTQNPQKNDDFAPLPIYKESTTANSNWVNVTLTRIDPDGTTTQTSSIVPKR